MLARNEHEPPRVSRQALQTRRDALRGRSNDQLAALFGISKRANAPDKQRFEGGCEIAHAIREGPLRADCDSEQRLWRRMLQPIQPTTFGDRLFHAKPSVLATNRRPRVGRSLQHQVASGGLAARDGKDLTHFTIAGEDKKFVWAKARIEGDKVVVICTLVPRATKEILENAMMQVITIKDEKSREFRPFYWNVPAYVAAAKGL